MVKRHVAWLFTTIKIAIDVLLIIIGFNLAWLLRYVFEVGGKVEQANFLPLQNYASLRLGLVGMSVGVFAFSGVYRVPRGRKLVPEALRLIQAILSAIGLLVIALFVIRISFSSRLLLAYAGVVVTLLLLSSRVAARFVKQILWRRGLGVTRVLVVGDSMAARDIMRDLIRHQAAGRQLWGCLTININQEQGAIVVDAGQPVVVPVHGGVDDLDAVMQAHNIRQVVIALPGSAVAETQRAVHTCIRRHVDFRLAPELYGVAANQVVVDDTYDRPVLTMRDVSHHARRRVVKRVLDIGLSIFVLFPFGLLVMLIVAIAIRLNSPGPIFFRQKRMTLDGSIFWVYKFRSMFLDAEARLSALEKENEARGPIFKMRDDPRITQVGKWLRRTSIDELPQVFNILMGEMSWVGPRPPLPAEVERYHEWQKRRLGTTTGLTGLWQVSGRSLLPFDDMVRLDLYYVENWSIWLDLKILLVTIPAVLKGKGAF